MLSFLFSFSFWSNTENKKSYISHGGFQQQNNNHLVDTCRYYGHNIYMNRSGILKYNSAAVNSYDIQIFFDKA